MSLIVGPFVVLTFSKSSSPTSMPFFQIRFCGLMSPPQLSDQIGSDSDHAKTGCRLQSRRTSVQPGRRRQSTHERDPQDSRRCTAGSRDPESPYEILALPKQEPRRGQFQDPCTKPIARHRVCSRYAEQRASVRERVHSFAGPRTFSIYGENTNLSSWVR